MAPLWEKGVKVSTPLLEKQTTPKGHTDTYILNATTIHAKLQIGNQQRPNNNLELALSTLIATLTLPISHGHRKLPKAIITKPVPHKMIFPTCQPKAREPISHWQTLTPNPETLGFG